MLTLYFRENAAEITICFGMHIDCTEDNRLARDSLDTFCKSAANRERKIILDFRENQFMTTAMISDLLLLSKAMNRYSLGIRCLKLNPCACEIFSITGLSNIFRYDDGGPGDAGVGVSAPQPNR